MNMQKCKLSLLPMNNLKNEECSFRDLGVLLTVDGLFLILLILVQCFGLKYEFSLEHSLHSSIDRTGEMYKFHVSHNYGRSMKRKQNASSFLKCPKRRKMFDLKNILRVLRSSRSRSESNKRGEKDDDNAHTRKHQIMKCKKKRREKLSVHIERRKTTSESAGYRASPVDT